MTEAHARKRPARHRRTHDSRAMVGGAGHSAGNCSSCLISEMVHGTHERVRSVCGWMFRIRSNDSAHDWLGFAIAALFLGARRALTAAMLPTISRKPRPTLHSNGSPRKVMPSTNPTAGMA